ncbi:MAG: hypothetical protein WCQ99_00015 [Pseudomonadota bacterium]
MKKECFSRKEYRCFAGAFFVGLIFLSFYIKYALSAWFYFDDFYFLDAYKNNINLDDIIHPANNMGRFVTRNLYWYSISNLFGRESSAFFFINLILIGGNCIASYFLIEALTKNRSTACFSALLYFVSPATVLCFSWISSSQHLIGHTFVFLFFLYAIKSDFLNPLKVKEKLITLLLFVLGVYSNAFFLCVLPVLLCYVLIHQQKKVFFNSLNVLLFGFMISIIFYMVINLAKIQTDLYATEFSFKTLINTSSYYLNIFLPFFRFMPEIVLPFFLTCISVCFFVFIIKNSEYRLLLLLLATFFFYLPVAFLIHMKNLTYIALPFFFITTALLYTFRNLWIMTIIIFILIIYGCVKVGLKYYEIPLGLEEKQFFIAFNQIKTGEHKTVLFRPVPLEKKYRLNIPNFWWRLYFGTALKVFSNPSLFYDLESNQLGLEKQQINIWKMAWCLLLKHTIYIML